MYKLVFINQSGLISSYINAEAPDLYDTSIDYNGQRAVYITEDLIDVIVPSTVGNYYYKDSFKLLPEKPSEYHSWNIDTETWEYSAELYNNYISRLTNTAIIKRNTLLLNSDWTELPSALTRLGQVKIDEWQTYRQALRDIPQQTGYPETIVWPEQPK